MTAFIGGIDLTTGRYDDAEHSLFRENHTVPAIPCVVHIPCEVSTSATPEQWAVDAPDIRT